MNPPNTIHLHKDHLFFIKYGKLNYRNLTRIPASRTETIVTHMKPAISILGMISAVTLSRSPPSSVLMLITTEAININTEEGGDVVSLAALFGVDVDSFGGYQHIDREAGKGIEDNRVAHEE